MRTETEYPTEFGLGVSWAMCRNPMCANFGIPFEGEFPEGRKWALDEHYTVRTDLSADGRRPNL